jgi:YidC/Oxa1 family membrane protein insertase
MIMLGRGVGGWVIPVAVALLGCRDPANDRPSILREAPEVTPAANDNADTTPRAPTAARPLSGGTLLVASDGRTAVSADPDHDRLWITDLSAMDPYFVLPILMGASMWVQFKLNPPPADPMQAAIFKWMPLLMTVMFLWFPSGLVLYWLCNNVLSIAQQWLILRKERAI